MGRYDDFNAYEREMWSSPRAAAYDRGLTGLTSYTAEALLDAVAGDTGLRVLDVGTGPGVVAARAAARGCEVVGVDVSPEMLAIARSRVDGDFREGSAEALPVGDAEVDAVVGNFIVLHLGHPERLAAETARVLRPGGWCAFTVWTTGDRNRVLGVFHDTLTRAAIAPPDDIPDGPLSVQFAEHDRFRSLLADAGLVDIAVREITWAHTIDPDAWWDATVASTPRTGALISRQPAAAQTRLRGAYDALVREPPAVVHADGSITLPAAAVIASGRRAE